MYSVQKIHTDKLLARQCTTNSTVVILFKQPLYTHFCKAQSVLVVHIKSLLEYNTAHFIILSV